MGELGIRRHMVREYARDDRVHIVSTPMGTMPAWFHEQFKQPEEAMNKKMAPFHDFNGQPIGCGDVLIHPTGERGTVTFDSNRVVNPWRLVYEDGKSLWLGHQVGAKGMAVKEHNDPEEAMTERRETCEWAEEGFNKSRTECGQEVDGGPTGISFCYNCGGRVKRKEKAIDWGKVKFAMTVSHDTPARKQLHYSVGEGWALMTVDHLVALRNWVPDSPGDLVRKAAAFDAIALRGRVVGIRSGRTVWNSGNPNSASEDLILFVEEHV